MSAPEFFGTPVRTGERSAKVRAVAISSGHADGSAAEEARLEKRADGVHITPFPSAQARMAAGALRANSSALKRAVDLLGAAAGLLALGPFLLLVAIIVRLESPGPALFRQRRTGRDGKMFQIYKFRSMTVTEDGGSVTQAAKDDARLTRIGGFLRRSCIDELPQLLNVLKGEMSLIGPRPHALAHDDYYGALIPGYEDRFLVKPGIAGLAQVSGHRGPTPTVEAMAARVTLDRAYVATWSFALDARILVRAVTEGPFNPAAF
jgi:lipopolysaccharide/colanic/teichoic acid biosynthesis glycosyltransferase